MEPGSFGAVVDEVRARRPEEPATVEPIAFWYLEDEAAMLELVGAAPWLKFEMEDLGGRGWFWEVSAEPEALDPCTVPVFNLLLENIIWKKRAIQSYFRDGICFEMSVWGPYL